MQDHEKEIAVILGGLGQLISMLRSMAYELNQIETKLRDTLLQDPARLRDGTPEGPCNE